MQGQVPPHVKQQVPPKLFDDPLIENAMYEEIRASMTLLSQALKAQDNIEEVDIVNPIGGMIATRVWEFLRKNPPEFYGSKIDKDPNRFIDWVYKVHTILGVSSFEKVQLANYQLIDFSLLLYEQWKDSIPTDAGSIEWETFKSAFLNKFFPI